MKAPAWRFLCLGFAAIFCTSPSVAAQALPKNAPRKLVAVRIAGNKRFPSERIVAASGLHIGQTVNLAGVESAAARLAEEGVFSNVEYRYQATASNIEIEFQVQEVSRFLPCTFDNLIWLGDDGISSELMRRLPLYDGTAPESGHLLEQITAVLEEMLRARDVRVRVEVSKSVDLARRISEHQFRALGVSLPIREIKFSGATPDNETALRKAAEPLLEKDYSRIAVRTFAEGGLVPVYRQRGHLRARFFRPEGTAQPGATNPTVAGVIVKFSVDEGIAYSWDGADWVGSEQFSPGDLVTLMGMQRFEPADGLKIDAGLEALATAYRNKGFLEIRTTSAQEFDDTTKRVRYRIAFVEGPQYRMGTLSLLGVPDNAEEKIRAIWKLKPGDIYNASYLAEFSKRDLPRAMAEAALRVRDVRSETLIDRQKHEVKVTIRFE